MYKIKYLPLADDDVLAAVDYIAVKLENPKAASDLPDELDKAVDSISRFPYASEPYHTDRPISDELRKVPVKNYVLYYTVTEDTVEIRRYPAPRAEKPGFCATCWRNPLQGPVYPAPQGHPNCRSNPIAVASI